MDITKRRIIMKSFITSQFSYCPLIWMFHSRRLNNKINSIHERALRITYGDQKSTFQELLIKDNSVSVHHRNLQVLATEIFKIENNMTPEFLNEIFQERIYRVNRLFVLAFEDDQPVKNNKVTYENIRKMATGQGDF